MNFLQILIALLALIIFFGLPVWNLMRLYGRAHVLGILVPVVLFISSMTSLSLLEYYRMDTWYIFVKSLMFYLLIIGLILFGFSVIWMIIGKLFKLPDKKIFWIIIITVFLYSLIARINGERIVVKHLDLFAENISREYQFVHITDLHSGSTDREHAQKVVNNIETLNPEFMVITGDFIDEYHVTESDIEPFNELDFPIYLITGNHEYYLEPGKINELIKNTKIQLIDDMKISFDELDIIGVNEIATVDGTINSLGGIDADRYSILLDHQPKSHEVYRAESHGVRLMLSGHTHNGQMWPMGWLMSLHFEFLSGLYEIGNMFLYINQGTGTLGPKMRIGTYNEITLITLIPKK